MSYSCADPSSVRATLPCSSHFLQTAILQLFHAEGLHSFAIFTLVIFFLVFAAFTCWTYGVAVPSGLFVPSLVAGAAFGKLVGILLNLAMPNAVVGSGTYALIGMKGGGLFPTCLQHARSLARYWLCRVAHA